MKVILMMAYFKIAETNPGVFSTKLYYDGTYDLNTIQYFSPSAALKPKSWYTVKQLIERMITESGNNSTYLLSKNYNESTLKNIALDLGIEFPDSEKFIDFLSAKKYSILFRVLYNATYLSREMSEEALSMLSKTTFKKGLVAGVPRNIIVAHKFGEHYLTEGSVKELHDCGIVYYSDSPYFLCVMTKGNNYDEMASVIAGISRVVFDYLNTGNFAKAL